MAIVITGRPNKDTSGFDSTWVAARNPVVYTFERQDYTLDEVRTSGYSTAQPTWAGTDVTTEFGPGKDIYFYSADYGYIYDKVFELTPGIGAVYGGGENLLAVRDTIGLGGPPFASGGFINAIGARPDYYIKVYLFDADTGIAVSSKRVTSNTHTYTADVSGLIRALITSKDVFQFDSVNHNDLYRTARFYIAYAEYYNGAEINYQVDGANVFTAISAANQIGSEFDGNMALNVAFDGFPTGDANICQFLTPFETPTYFEGWPFSIDFLLGGLSSPKIERVETVQDQNGSTVLGPTNTTLTDLTFTGVQRLTLAGSYPATADKVQVYINTGPFVPGPSVGDFNSSDFDDRDFYTELG